VNGRWYVLDSLDPVIWEYNEAYKKPCMILFFQKQRR